MYSNESLNKLAGGAAICVATLLIFLKIFVWYTTRSISVQASLFDSLLDGITSLINFIAITHAVKPADNCHRWGHGKAESLASFAQSIFIAGSAVWLLFNIFHQIYDPEPIVDTGLGVALMIFATFCTLALVLFQRFVIKRTGSLVVQADSLHYETDLLANIGVLVSLVLSVRFKFIYLDLIIGFIIVIYILMSTWDIFKHSCNILMDRELDESIREEILQIARKKVDVNKIKGLRTRSSGTKSFVELSLEFDPKITVKETQKVAKKISEEIQKKVENVEVIVHSGLL